MGTKLTWKLEQKKTRILLEHSSKQVQALTAQARNNITKILGLVPTNNETNKQPIQLVRKSKKEDTWADLLCSQEGLPYPATLALWESPKL